MAIRKLDNFDLLMLATLVGLLLGIGVLLLGGDTSREPGTAPAFEAALQQKLLRQARFEHLEQLYRPVSEALRTQRYPEALLALDEISRSYPGEPHGLMLKGEVQLTMGAVNEGVVNVASAVRRDADYLEEESPLSRRSLLEQLVMEELPRLRELLRDNDPSPVQLRTLQELRYLQSRLAGGCE
ncbi:MAG: hypothetical protein C0624_05750 [Desulfuromonas sp.]|nr:MAG: hypothetical protein C0624_05750 [Desulfuromonas sp.]